MLSASSEEFHNNVMNILESSANTLFTKIEQIEALNGYSRPQASMFMMVRLLIILLSYTPVNHKKCEA